MPAYDILSLPGSVLQQLGNNMSTGADLQFTLAHGVFDSFAFNVDDIFYAQLSGRLAYKGLLKKIQRSTQGESFACTIQSAEQIIESQPWQAQVDAYNTESDVVRCGKGLVNQTIQQVITKEFTGSVATWFNSITVAASLQTKIAGAVTTYQKGFFAFLQAILAPYPNAQWVIDYSTPTGSILPVGDLIIVDTAIGRTSHAIPVGGATTVVASLDVTEDGSETAENIRVYGRGQFVERCEVLTPAWFAADEQIPVSFAFKGPSKVEDYSYFFFGHTVMTQPVITMKCDPANPTAYIQLFYGADFLVDYKNGLIQWQVHDYMIDRITGQMEVKPAGGISNPGKYRSCAAFNGNHLNKDAIISYTFLGDDCYRKYKTAYPIANLKLAIKRVPTPGSPSVPQQVPVELSPTLDAFKPNINIADATVVKTDPAGANYVAKWITPAALNITDMLKGFPNKADTPSFQEGTSYLFFDVPQVILYDFPIGLPAGVPQPAPIAYDILVYYTSWQEFVVTHTNTLGAGRYAQAVSDSILKYTDIQGAVLVDDTTQLSASALAVKEYFGSAIWSGAMTLVISQSSGLWVVPWKPGDKVTITGPTGLSGVFSGLINSIDMSQIDQGRITLQFGRLAPRKNPFAPKAPVVSNIETGGVGTNEDVSGLNLI